MNVLKTRVRLLQSRIDSISNRINKEFNESDHPRDKEGQFTSTGGVNPKYILTPEQARAFSRTGRLGPASKDPTNENYTFRGTKETGPTKDDLKFVGEFPTDDNLSTFVRRFGRAALPKGRQ